VLPVICLAVGSVCAIARLTRSSMLDTLSQDYVRTARSKGLSPGRILRVHVLRNSLIPVVTSLGMTFAALLTGTFVIEKIFAIPGLGRYFVDSISNRDYTTVHGPYDSLLGDHGGHVLPDRRDLRGDRPAHQAL
jgi:dipeptide transport system permease protein